MLSTFFKFELRAWLRTPMPYIFLLIFGLLSFGGTISDDISIGGSFGNIQKNAPYVAQTWYSVFSLLSLLLATAFMNSGALRDFEANAHQIVFSKPIGKAQYYFGHFLGALLASLIPMLGVSLGVWVGTALNGVFEWMDPGRFGPLGLTGHLEGFWVFIIPNAIFISSVTYAVAINTRSTLYSFIAGIALLVGYIMAGTLTRNLENETLAAMLDPFGIRTFGVATKYWTVDMKNTSALGLTGLMLWNRLLWVGIGLVVLAIGYFRFSFAEKTARVGLFKRKKTVASTAAPAGMMFSQTPIPQVHVLEQSTGLAMRQFWSQFVNEMRYVVKSVPFALLALLGILNALGSLTNASDGYDTHELPVTYTMINYIRGSFYMFMLIIMVYFSGQLVWKERTARMSDIIDAMPTKNWTALLGKFCAVLVALMLLQCVVIGVAVACQASDGYFRFDLWTYFREMLVMDMLGFAFILALSFMIQAFSPNLYIGFFVVIIFLALSNFGLQAIDWVSNMVDFGGLPQYTLSDFYGYQPFSNTLGWFSGYWSMFCMLLGLVAILFWARGRETGWKNRFRIAGAEWKNYKGTAYLAVGGWAIMAAWVFYNTKVVNEVRSPKMLEKRSVSYENQYKQYEKMAQPRVYDVKWDITLQPETRSMQVIGKYAVRNIRAVSMDTLLVNVPTDVDFEIRCDRLKLLKDDEKLKFRIYKIEPALTPQDSMLIEFTSSYAPKGFQNEVGFSRLVQNGTFFDNSEVAPLFGYNSGGELSDKNDRKKYGLAEKTRMPALDRTDTLARMDSYIGNGGDWVSVETVMRTSPDQIALAPGSLVREWTEGGRRCFQYKLDQKSYNFYSFLSARYEVAKRDWNGIQLEVYYHKDHTANVERMLDAEQKALEYYTKNFGPYFHKQCRIIEFPRFSDFAQAFPGTMPYSEGIGFIQDFKASEDDIDMVTYVAAHEIGHQYWGHQECGAAMQGSEMLVETFAQYSALMVMEHTYGKEQMNKFLKFEMDKYLRGRSREPLKELPLSKCENQQYIHYNKGSVAMYALKEAIGEDQLNAALRQFLERFRYADAPYPVSLDALDAFAAHTPDSLKYIIKDWFEDITIYENVCETATMKPLSDGKYEVTIALTCRKQKADDQGRNTDATLDEYLEIGAFDKAPEGKKRGKLLYREKVRVKAGANKFTFVVAAKPHRAGIDPFSLLVDLSPEDNMKDVKEE
jgi:ABC-2 type transport system permease protein